MNGDTTTSSQRLHVITKAAREIMRKDKGLSGDLDRLPMLTWLMFLKFIDDREISKEKEASGGTGRHRPLLDAPYRWRDWAADSHGLTGEKLKAFVNHDEVLRTDGIRGLGLLAYLRSLADSHHLTQQVVGGVFGSLQNRMESGYLLRDLINKVNEIDFNSSEDVYVLGQLYESLIREMRDAAGDSGEFYTPRPLVRLMVNLVNPRLGERVMDPACGTGGFLIETVGHLEKQVKSAPDRKTLQEKSVFGQEAKHLPFVLCQMNLLLHGINVPRVVRTNSLGHRIAAIRDEDKYDVILTNPPFGGGEERAILDNFPADRQTTDTALLFLQLIMALLDASSATSRAALIVPNGILFGDGVGAKIKEDLLARFNLHTIIRMPTGVFAPYTSIPTNLLFFDCSGPTKEIWFYEHAVPDGRRQYTKTRPLQYEDFADCLAWWANRTKRENSWSVEAREVAAAGYNLDFKNPKSATDFEHLPPKQLAKDILATETRIVEVMRELLELLENEP